MAEPDRDLVRSLVERARECREPGCRTVLSRYNDGVHCALHAPMQVPRTRGASSEPNGAVFRTGG